MAGGAQIAAGDVTLFTYMTTVASVLFILEALHKWLEVHSARRKGVYPAKGKATMEDVRRLALSGETRLAIRAYREIHAGMGTREAKDLVDKMVTTGGKNCR